MRIFRSLLPVALALAALPCQGHASLTLVDQQYVPASSSLAGDPTGTVGVGQSFTPAQASIDAATFSLSTSASSSTFQLMLFSGAGYTGTLLATSAPIIIRSTAVSTVEFAFAAPVTLVPNNVYTLDVRVTAGDAGDVVYATNSTYAGGTFFGYTGNANSAQDLQFAEGTDAALAPEPSTWAILAAGAGLLGVIVRRGRARLV